GGPISEGGGGGNAPVGSARGRQRRTADGGESLVGRPGQGCGWSTDRAPAGALRRTVLPDRRRLRAGAGAAPAHRLEPEVARGGQPACRRLGGRSHVPRRPV